jgi:hypothetical protein
VASRTSVGWFSARIQTDIVTTARATNSRIPGK